MNMKERIREIAVNVGISQIGTVKAEVFYDLGTLLERKGKIPMTSSNIESRINPFLLMPEAKSIIVCLFPYHAKTQRGNISKYAQGMDYHGVVKDKLSHIIDFLNENDFLAKAFCDNANLNERYLAYKAGLGFYGKNGFLINPIYGTYTFIGYILTDCNLETDKPLSLSCADCLKCIKACPGGALDKNFGFHAEKCVSYITQKKGMLSDEETRLLKESGYVWGCDICQDVCPHNKQILCTEIDEFRSNLIQNLTLDKETSNRDFKKMYSHRAFAWRGKSTLLRNLDIMNENDKKH
ncbi:MAG: tRNA epoxyqueuosine(34) reductase QueG [Clostridia bacterium]|nr:tRNA epoxyqueuosine(34) reductase QueG [Clostridia bacterium]